MNIHFETDELIVRDLEQQDLEGIFLLDSDPEVHEFLGKRPIKTIEEAQKVVDYITGQYKTNGIGRWAVIDKATNDFVGWTGLKYEEELRTEFNYYDIGYRLRKKYWGKGIATTTALASLKYGFEKLNLEEICGAAEIDHIASNTVLKKIGLKLSGTFMYDNEPHNWYKITKEEWINNQKK
ncbi:MULTISPECIES: GNAT family N-acetyltransferase [Flammeovirga]|uniref:GNAT family N-acetyltransferase n=1 Tax=Flammeovirga agarivorans TaxID=2726742 RepID=A0A7X8SJV6_9BACT|nr:MULTISPECIES: GNAT family N-acetyltransferase [Flammeovirga]NLR91482.1 GNAT family N-acetyltransferase [Flammeovirga agarivorans]